MEGVYHAKMSDHKSEHLCNEELRSILVLRFGEANVCDRDCFLPYRALPPDDQKHFFAECKTVVSTGCWTYTKETTPPRYQTVLEWKTGKKEECFGASLGAYQVDEWCVLHDPTKCELVRDINADAKPSSIARRSPSQISSSF